MPHSATLDYKMLVSVSSEYSLSQHARNQKSLSNWASIDAF